MRKALAIVLGLLLILSCFFVGATAEETVTLDYWIRVNSLDDPDEIVKEKPVVAAFERANPGIHINLIPIGNNADDYNAKWQMAAATDSLPDLLNTSFGLLDEWAEANVVTDITFLKDDEAFMSRFRPGAWADANRYCPDGKVYGFPIEAEAQGWAYNMEYFERYDLKIPETFEELLHCVKVFRENGVLPIAHGATDIWAIWGYHAMFCRYGVNEELCKKLSANEITWADCEPYRKTFERILELSQAGAFAGNVATTSDAQAKALFVEGSAAMYTFATSFINELDVSPHAANFVFNWGPEFSDGVYDKRVGLKPFGEVIAVGSRVGLDPAKLAAVGTFFKYIAGEEATSLYFKESGHITATSLSGADTSSLTPFYANVFDAMNEDVIVVPDLCQAWFDASIKVPYRNAVTAMITQTLTVDEALQLLQDWSDVQ